MAAIIQNNDLYLGITTCMTALAALWVPSIKRSNKTILNNFKEQLQEVHDIIFPAKTCMSPRSTPDQSNNPNLEQYIVHNTEAGVVLEPTWSSPPLTRSGRRMSPTSSTKAQRLTPQRILTAQQTPTPSRRLPSPNQVSQPQPECTPPEVLETTYHTTPRRQPNQRPVRRRSLFTPEPEPAQSRISQLSPVLGETPSPPLVINKERRRSLDERSLGIYPAVMDGQLFKIRSPDINSQEGGTC